MRNLKNWQLNNERKNTCRQQIPEYTLLDTKDRKKLMIDGFYRCTVC